MALRLTSEGDERGGRQKRNQRRERDATFDAASWRRFSAGGETEIPPPDGVATRRSRLPQPWRGFHLSRRPNHASAMLSLALHASSVWTCKLRWMLPRRPRHS